MLNEHRELNFDALDEILNFLNDLCARIILSLTLVKLPKMEKWEIEKLIKEQAFCRIAFKGAEYPFMAPFQYVFVDGSLYFHFTDYGKKMRLLETDNRVCVEIEKYRPGLSEYNFRSKRQFDFYQRL